MFLTIILVLCIIVWVATWVYAVIDMFRRKDMKGWHIAAWLAAVIIFPLFGLVAYILARPPAGQVEYKGEEIG